VKQDGFAKEVYPPRDLFGQTKEGQFINSDGPTPRGGYIPKKKKRHCSGDKDGEGRHAW